ncbi:NETI motif-containing protein [Bacillus subtilis]|nr:NETI motif-containing protein [Bacillus subtilis]WGD58426.1 NETI motif-containing protein [Bacillus subtilis]WGD64788.1 NETI motif-containing protein [Bacillus subtilis]WGD73468.1 NETI motif-containing protein [Bacillus subtilis]WGD81535.1 NETI motif-containing protein [Bacillus subtilis]
MAKPKKKKFEVTEQQTIDAVLQQMKEEGYLPVRRMEEPIFMEKEENGSIQIVPCGKKIVFEGKLI